MVPVEFFVVVVGNNQITNINIHLGKFLAQSIQKPTAACLRCGTPDQSKHLVLDMN